MKKVLTAVLLMAAMMMTLTAPALGDIDPEAQSIGLEGVGNARDLGGYPAGDGRTVKWGAFLRTAALGGATEGDIQRLKDVYHLSVVADLRMTSEIEGAPDPEIDGVKYLHLGIMDEEALAEKRANLRPEDVEDLDMTDKLDRLKLAFRLGIVGDQMYIDFLSAETGRTGYARMFREILDMPEDGALLFHCTQGKDRTGCAAMLILSALGVDEDTILQDYMLTNTFNAELIESERKMLIDWGVDDAELDTYMIAMDAVNIQYMINALDWMKANYGSALGYITAELGVTDDEIEMLRDRYLEEETAYADAA